ncbi:MAG: DUF2461 family protein [bacterium]
MKNEIFPFTGFKKEIFNYLKALQDNNNIVWFNQNKQQYTDLLITPAKAYIKEMGNFFNALDPAIRTEPKFNHTIMRLNKDMRFNKGEPYRNYLLIHFGRFKMDSEFFLFFDPNECQIGLFINGSSGKDLYFKENFQKYNNEIKAICKKYKIDGNYSLYELNKNPEQVVEKFYFNKHSEYLKKFRLLIFQKIITPTDLKLYSSELLVESLKIFFKLYPLYCFAISPEPLKLIQKFEDTFDADF